MGHKKNSASQIGTRIIPRRSELPPQIGIVASYKPKLWHNSENFFYRESIQSYGD